MIIYLKQLAKGQSMKLKRIIITLFIGIFSLSALSAEVHHYTLDNGLQIFVKEDHRAPVVVSQIWYKVGSSNEKNGITGISHVLEHMMFRGTKKYGPGVFSKMISANGGEENAFTTADFTVYYQVLEASKLPLSFKLESDRMRNLILTEKIFDKERQVVMEERRLRVVDNPQALTYQRFRAAAFISSPYHHPVIGWVSDLKNMTLSDIKQWYKKWYVPNNALLVVVGDVNSENVLKLAKKYYGNIQPEGLVPPTKFEPTVPLGERNVKVNAPAKLPWIVMGYNVPVLNSFSKEQDHWQAYALLVLSGVLDGGDSSRLTKNLVRGKQIASGVSADYSPFSRLSNLLTLSGTPSQGHTLTQLQKALVGEIKTLQEKLVKKDELARIKAQVIASKIFQKDSMSAQANEVGALEAVGLSWKVGSDFVKNVDAVTPEQIRDVAKKYLVTKRLTVGRLNPIRQPARKKRDSL